MTHRPPIALPGRLSRLEDLAYDISWSWDHQARSVFRRLDVHAWRATAHNPVRMLRTLPAEVLERAAADPAFLECLDHAVASLDRYRSREDTWWAARSPSPGATIAYFSAEFALHQSLPLYAGGLGVLAGDHCKEASDLGIPLVGVGFMYPQGYFHQRISSEGWQEEHYERLNWLDAPIARVDDDEGRLCIVPVPLGDRTVLVSIWEVVLGRTRLYLLDTDLEENAPWDRELSARLYGGDQQTRLQQEIVLGVGGVRALGRLGIHPDIWHLNEGHAALVALQRIRDLVEAGRPFDIALADVQRTTAFTTHTPVPAGHDAFPFHTVEEHLAGCWGPLGEDRERFLALGHHDAGHGPQFNMTALALRTAARVNAVSRLHGVVTTDMWKDVRTDPAGSGEAPVLSITNGVHVATWLAREWFELYEEVLGPDWYERHDDPALWDAVLAIPDERIWRLRQTLRTRLFDFIRERIRRRWRDEHVTPARVVAAGTLLDPTVLTIGFARRFATYKRPDLIFSDPDRLARLLNCTERPVQIVFAGKAHPADEGGKSLLQSIYRRAIDPAFGGRISIVADYDVHAAHLLVQGCDVWLNNPRRPMEASGTSGMKATLNGGLHLSVSDGWWPEGFNGRNGWMITPAVDGGDEHAMDLADAKTLYDLLEQQVVPTFYARDAEGLPREWVSLIKESIRTITPAFSTRRMLKDYAQALYAQMLATL